MASEKLSPLIREVTRERDRALQWRLVSLGLAEGLKTIGNLVVDKNRENIFVKDIEKIISGIKEDEIDYLYKFFCENDILD